MPLERLSREELWGIEKKHEVFVEELYGAGSTRMDGATSADPEPGERAYLGMFGDCAAYEIAGGIDFEQAASFCVRLL